jgi:hypothetical protein
MDIPTFVSVLQAHGEAAAAKASDLSPTLVWLVPLLPVFGFLFQTFIGRKLPKPIIAFVSCGVVLGSCVIAWSGGSCRSPSSRSSPAAWCWGAA